MNGHRFADANTLSSLAASWPATRLIEIWNKLPNVTMVRRFTDRRTAVRRIWRALQKLERSRTKQCCTTGARPGRSAAQTDRAGREVTKTERIIALLMRASGATTKDIIAETGWQPHSVRAFISRLSSGFEFRVRSFTRGGERVYRIRS